jgi:hypothetical protein
MPSLADLIPGPLFLIVGKNSRAAAPRPPSFQDSKCEQGKGQGSDCAQGRIPRGDRQPGFFEFPDFASKQEYQRNEHGKGKRGKNNKTKPLAVAQGVFVSVVPGYSFDVCDSDGLGYVIAREISPIELSPGGRYGFGKIAIFLLGIGDPDKAFIGKAAHRSRKIPVAHVTPPFSSDDRIIGARHQANLCREAAFWKAAC